MKTIVQTGAESVTVQDQDRPTCGDHDVLVRVHTAGLCGSDAHAYRYEEGYEWIPLPRIMGHEYAGTVVEVGAAVDEFVPGDKVVEEPVHNCGSCFQCKNGQPNVCQNFHITGMHGDGAYAEFTTVEPRNLHAVPDTIPLKHASITEPLSIATRAVLTQSMTSVESTVLVEGPGPIGVFVASVADAVGARVVVSGIGQDRQYRLPLLEELGIETINIETNSHEQNRNQLTDGRGFDVVFDTTGHPSGIEQAVDHVRKGGEIIMVGLPNATSEVFFTPMVRGEIALKTSYGSTWTNFEQALQLIERDEIDFETIIDDSYDIADPDTAFRAFLNSETCKPVFSFADL
ncbi:alcohol dehydrogenase catalytic domain-containing protein [Halobacteria archaeon AArc-curdl1]|uniref:Alcohol dehydrogenase catalytic domain-containing protein n=1 Tax=Natronosalvus hydrolyticus TaxID=2979988 RepID=A0AAP3E639_9EURY|nr:alcohol dehydrogenase catalytic domain-containing protein [Halobacteria archaeon AArc-curdl1]